MCRVELPPGPEQLNEEGTRRFFDVQRRVDRGEASWGALTKAQQREMNKVIGLLRKAADQGDALAQNILGLLYALGQGAKQDFGEAVRWYRKAAAQGHADAQCHLAAAYAKGQGVKQDLGEAVRLFRKAADQGDGNAQFNLGVMYAQGQGAQQDFAEAARWRRMAAEKGLINAQLSLGNMYYSGQGVEEDHTEALRWVRLAEAQGSSQAKDIIQLLEYELYTLSAAAGSASSLPICANCSVTETAGSAVLNQCSRCKAVVYCGKACQAQHWKAGGHRAACCKQEKIK
jgi:hypothetical protein